MQTIEMLKKHERMLALQIQLLLCVVVRQTADLPSVIARYFRLREMDLMMVQWSKDARKRCKRYCIAMQSGDILGAAKQAECIARETMDASSVDGAIARIAALDFERRGLAENLGWLEESVKEIDLRGPTHFLNMVDVTDPAEPIETTRVAHNYPCLAWSGRNRVVRNRAYHEVCVKFGLKRLRRAVKADLNGPATVFNDVDGKPDPDLTYGKVLHRDYAKLLLERFLTNTPDPSLVGTVSV
jgi:hypothetical protein